VTFLQSLNAFSAFGDRVLAKALGAVDAGACVPEHGQNCACYFVQGDACWPQKREQFKISCFGACIGNVNGPCC
jgi:hypothetical protein